MAYQQMKDGIGDAPAIQQAFQRYPKGILVKQTMRGCLRNCLGCQAQTEYKLSDMDWQFLTTGGVRGQGIQSVPDSLYILEESSCCLRTCWRDGRPLEFNVSNGSEPGGAPVAKYSKSCGCPLYFCVPCPTSEDGDISEVPCPCCCFLPSLSLDDGTGGEASKSEYLCRYNSCCIPQLMYHEEGKPVYYLAPDTFCFGCCVQCKGSTGRKGCFQVPFYLHDAQMQKLPPNADGHAPQISKVWSGMKKECCSTADNFMVMWPDGIDAKRKAGLLGLTLLLDFTVFERQQENDV